MGLPIYPGGLTERGGQTHTRAERGRHDRSIRRRTTKKRGRKRDKERERKRIVPDTSTCFWSFVESSLSAADSTKEPPPSTKATAWRKAIRCKGGEEEELNARLWPPPPPPPSLPPPCSKTKHLSLCFTRQEKSNRKKEGKRRKKNERLVSFFSTVMQFEKKKENSSSTLFFPLQNRIRESVFSFFHSCERRGDQKPFISSERKKTETLDIFKMRHLDAFRCTYTSGSTYDQAEKNSKTSMRPSYLLHIHLRRHVHRYTYICRHVHL